MQLIGYLRARGLRLHAEPEVERAALVFFFHLLHLLAGKTVPWLSHPTEHLVGLQQELPREPELEPSKRDPYYRVGPALPINIGCNFQIGLQYQVVPHPVLSLDGISAGS